MSELSERRIIRDRFEVDVRFETTLAFPCCVCKHRHVTDREEPCILCEHNLAATTETQS